MRETAQERQSVQDERPESGHHTQVTERGSFVSARCDCGWRGPARRARDTARTDAATHAVA